MEDNKLLYPVLVLAYVTMAGFNLGGLNVLQYNNFELLRMLSIYG